MSSHGFANLDEVADALRARLDATFEAREAALQASRDLVRRCREVMQAIHRGEDAHDALQNAVDHAADLQRDLADHPQLRHAGFVRNAQQELAEAVALRRAVDGRDLPGPDELPVTPAAYLLGLGDLAGELRRLALDAMEDDEADATRGYLDALEALHHALMRFDYPSGFLNVKRKQDTARSLLDRTRGEVAVGAQRRRLEDAVEHVHRLLEDAGADGSDRAPDVEAPSETGGVEEVEEDVDLDIDSVW